MKKLHVFGAGLMLCFVTTADAALSYPEPFLHSHGIEYIVKKLFEMLGGRPGSRFDRYPGREKEQAKMAHSFPDIQVTPPLPSK
ncbi:MAG: hypothetical protein BMS9Abin36_2250 [Gammaproteobacteria bacterium]|nr:MAG: hypothetical protein BMS9Abin36_2250 [Gammaproteobacteria bacterium]